MREDEEENWTPDKDRKNDPGSILREYMEMIKGMVNPSPQKRMVLPPAPSHMIHARIELAPIDNGWIMTYGDVLPAPRHAQVFVRNPEEAAAALPKAMAAVSALRGEFLRQLTPPPAAGEDVQSF